MPPNFTKYKILLILFFVHSLVFMGPELVIEGKALIRNLLQNCAIGIEEGKIVAIKKVLVGEKNIDFGQKLILPGMVDSHVHFREPGYTSKEDFYHGTLSGLFGGVTCALDMPNTIPPTADLESLRLKESLAKKSCIDYGFHALLTLRNLHLLRTLNERVAGFKIFLAGGEDLVFPIEDLPRIREYCPENFSAKTLVFHAEDPKLFKLIKSSNPVQYMHARPSEAEASAISKIIKALPGFKIHIAHLSSKKGVEILGEVEKNKNISAGVTPHHLLLNADFKISNPSLLKVNPPLRSENDSLSLMKAIDSGVIQCIETDHAPHTLEEKQKDFHLAPSGIPGIETALPLLLKLWKDRKLSLSRIVECFSTNPSNIFRIKQKGEIKLGKDADLVVVSLKDSRKFSPDSLHSKCGYTPFLGMEGIFPSDVFLRGERIIHKHEFAGESGMGKKILTGEDLQE
jgi:dihydroorotase